MKSNREKLSEALDKRGYKNEDLINEIEKIYNKQQLSINDDVKPLNDTKVPTFVEFITNYGLEPDRDNEYFFDNNYYTFEGLYYKYSEYFDLNP